MFRPFRALANWSVGLPKGDRVRPRVALRSTLGYFILPRWGERSDDKTRGLSPRFVGAFRVICSWGPFRKTLDIPNRQCNFALRLIGKNYKS